MARTRMATSSEKPDPNTVASLETGTALDSDLPADTGGGLGALTYRNFEVTDMLIPAGTSDPYVIGNVELPVGSTALASLLLTLDAPPSVQDAVQLVMWDPITAAPANGLTSAGAACVVVNPYVWIFAVDIIVWATTAGSITEDPPPEMVTLQAVLAVSGAPTDADITIAQARIKLLIL